MSKHHVTVRRATRARRARLALAALLASSLPWISAWTPASAEEVGPRRGFGPQGPQVVSPEVSPDRKITFRILAPKAEAVRLSGSDIPGVGRGAEMAKGESGVWEATLGTTETPVTAPSVAEVPTASPPARTVPAEGLRPSRAGRERGFMMPRPGPCPLPILPALAPRDDTGFYASTEVPHGRVVRATYENFSGREKRMHVYLPPGYDASATESYPVLYLNHGGGDDDSKWTSTATNGGNAQSILDNLIAAGKARRMIIVMPNTRGIASAEPPPVGEDDACTREYVESIIPYVESHYRAKPGRENRALAGLSMGGFVVLHTGLSRLDTFGELYVYSSGHFPDRRDAFQERFKDLLESPETNDRLRVPLYMAAGETDIALRNSQGTLSIFNRHGIRSFWVLSSGGHDWNNWRRYLHQTAQIMFLQGEPPAPPASGP
jgi:enterochelin esterase family protein